MSAKAPRPRQRIRKALVGVVTCVSSLDLFLPSAAARFVEDAGHGFFAMTCPKGKRCENARPVPISPHERTGTCPTLRQFGRKRSLCAPAGGLELRAATTDTDRKSTRLNSSHSQISYAVFCLKKKTRMDRPFTHCPPHRST